MSRARILLPVPKDARARRFGQLYTGLALYGLSIALMVRADLGLSPWDVLHQGVAERSALTIGQSTVAISVVVLALWIPLRQRAGIGTLSNGVFIGVFVDLWLLAIPDVDAHTWRAAFLVLGVALNGVATGLYIGAGLGPGPRDGLMTGIAARGFTIRLVRTGMEAIVLGIGWLLGGTVGVGTLLYAAAIGPIAHVTIPLFTRSADHRVAGRAPQE